ncbi:NifU family protein [Algoriphagus namhaensis]|uniref:NifU family protein n=1 Tax=Algoriphagus namhaensis TaxID=915353 RepID=A0ABV8AUR6_9BACT
MEESLKNKIETALDSIRPYLEADGGNVRVVELDENMVLKIEMLGNCGSCPMSTMTLKAGVEEAIKRAIPEITKVEAINLTLA